MKHVRVVAAELYFLPAKMRTPYKFGDQTLTEVTCARVKITVESEDGKQTCGWGETPLNACWVWPSDLSYSAREEALKNFCCQITKLFPILAASGHAFDISHSFTANHLHDEAEKFSRTLPVPMPHLAAPVCFSAFDIALHDAYSRHFNVSAFETLNADFMDHDLSYYLESVNGHSFEGEYPQDYLIEPMKQLPVWHSVGGVDPLDNSELTGSEVDDGYPLTLEEWIIRDQLNCLKIKLRGTDSEWDYNRLVKIGKISIEKDVDWLTADFNCTVKEPAYVNKILDRLKDSEPRIYGMLLYVEQPFPYDLEKNKIDVHSCSARKPLFIDESAHDWKFVRMGYELGWNGVALKTCKTFTGAMLSLCWAKAHGMALMVQDLTNLMLAQIPHVQLASYAGTIMGLESNGMQFYPEASNPEKEIHPHIYNRSKGILDLSTLAPTGFGYRIDEIKRQLPDCTAKGNALCKN